MSEQAQSVEDTLYPQDAQSEESSSEVESSESKEESVEESVEESKEEESQQEEKDVKEEEGKEEESFELELGEDSQLDDKALEEVKSFAKENGLSKEAAQKVLEMKEGVVSELVEKAQAKEQEQIEAWAKEVKDDPELGGENFNRNVEVARRAVEKFGGEEMKELLNETGYGNHPLVVKFFKNVGELIEDDKFVSGKQTSSQKSLEDIFYPGQN